MKPSEMSDGELRIKVAELLGWKNVKPMESMEHIVHGTDPTTGWEFVQPPNYPIDLNACAKMETALFGHDDGGHLVGCYLANLRVTANTRVSEWRLPFATARQRCEAFVAVMEQKR